MSCCEGDDPIGSLWGGYSWIPYGVARIGASCETASSTQGPLPEGFVPSQPAPNGVLLQSVRGDPLRIGTTGRGWGAPCGDDHRPLDDLGG